MRVLLKVLFVAGVDVVRHDQVLSAGETDGAVASEMVRNHQAVVGTDGMDVSAAADLALSDTPTGECELGEFPDANGPVYMKGDNRVTFGFQEKDVKCERCSSGWSSDAGWHYEYDYYWNAAVGTKAFWIAHADHYKNVSLFEGCPDPFVRDYKVDVPGAIGGTLNFFAGDRHCVLPDDMRFLGETCTHKSQCTHLSKWLDLTCAPTGEPDATMRCMYAEDAKGAFGGYEDNICECNLRDLNFGIFYCTNDKQCAGNSCVRSTYDMKFHCNADDSPSGQCSNCRASGGTKPCEHPDIEDIWSVHTSAQMIADGKLPLKPAA